MKKLLLIAFLLITITHVNGQFVIILSPNGGETFTIGSQQTITWASIGINSIDIAYSTDNGATFIDIDTSVNVFANSYTWTVTGPVSNNALIRLTEASTGVVSDLSNASFNIVNPSIQLTSPSQGAIFNPGQQTTITWNGNLVSNNVSLLFSSNNGSTFDTIVANIPNTNAYNWTVPPVASTTCKVKVMDASAPAVQNISATFTIDALPSSGSIISPNGGENINSTTNYNITWNSDGTSIIDLEYTTNGGATWQVIAQNIPAVPASYSWTVPSVNTSNAKVRIKNAINNLVLDESNNFFTITQPIPTLNLLSPFGFENWAVGSTQIIQWSYSFIGTIKIEYSIDGGSTYNLISASTPASDNSYPWVVPSGVSSNAFIRISDNNSSLTSQNQSAFSIVNPFVTVISPNGGQILNPNTTINIDWSGAVASGLIKIELTTNNGSTWTVIGNNIPNNGVFPWIVPNIPSTNCRLRISDALFPLVNDQSNSNFTISAPTPSISLLSPNGGEQIAAGTYYYLLWNTINIANIKIEYSTNNGASWETIQSLFPAALGSYAWLVPNIQTDSTLVKISNAVNVNINDISSSVFEVYSPNAYVDLLYPTGGEQLSSGISAPITWNSLNVDFVAIEYSINNGVNWQIISGSFPASAGIYHWDVPNIIINTVKIRIRDINNPAVNDQSAFYLSIIQPSISFNSFPSGSNFSLFSNINLLWLSTGLDNQSLRLEYSGNNGLNWTTLASGINNIGTYNWLINSPPNISCIFRISVESNPNIFAISPGAINIVSAGAAIIILTPTSNEVISSGGIYPITWNSYGMNYVRIEYSVNGDSIFQLITPFTPAATGSYNWTVPSGLNAVNCKIKISNAANTALNALTAFNFFIQTGQVFVSSGNSPGINTAGDGYLISWYANSISPYVDIEYSKDSSNWITIAAHYPNTGSYNWTIPYIEADTVWYRVSDHLNPNIADVNDASQKIILLDSLISLTNPDSSIKILTGSQYNITWDSYGITNIDIDFSNDNGISWSSIAQNVNADLHEYEWQVPNSVTNSALIRIKNSNYPTQFSQNQTSFSINNFFINITAPNGGETLINNSNSYITWQSLGIDFIDLYYSTDGGASYTLIDSNVFNVGYFNWSLSTTSSNNCKIKIADSNNQYTFDESNAVFSINNSSPQISLLSPNGGELIISNNGYYITWQSAGIGNIDISYSLNGGTTYLPIATNVPSVPSYYYWYVPDTATFTAKIKINANSNQSLNDFSNGNFSINNGLSELDLLTPNGGQTFNSWSYQLIKWKAINAPFVKLYYSTNGGSSYTYINSVLNDSSYLWQVPSLSSLACRIKIEDGNNATIVDVSSAVFAIDNQPISNNQIQIDSLASSNICAGGNFSLSYNVNGNFNSGNHFRVHLSDPSGSFTTFTDIGGISSSMSGNIQCNIPSNVLTGNSYTLRIVSDNPVAIGTNYGYSHISVNKANADFSSDKQLALFPTAIVNFTSSATSNSMSSSNWNTGNGGIYYSTNAQHFYNTAGKYSVTHTVSDTLGCSSSVTKNLHISVEHLFNSDFLNSNSIQDIVDIAFENERYGCAILRNGNCLVSNDSGKTWINTYTITGNTILNTIAIFNGTWYITTDDGYYLKSTDKGLTWLAFTFNNNESLRDVYFIEQNNAITAGNNGKILKFNGTIWQNQNTGTNRKLNKIAYNSTQPFVVGDNATILKLQNNVWTSIACPINVNLNSICFKDSIIGFIAADFGFILKSINGGNTWNVVLSGADVNFKDITCSGDSIWAVATDGIVYTSINNGLNWNRFSIGETVDLNSIIYNNNRGYIVGNNGLLRTFNKPIYVPVINATSNYNAHINIRCFPNPTTDVIYIDCSALKGGSVRINLFDIHGRKLYESISNDATLSSTHKIDLNAFAEGIYFVSIINDATHQTFKIIKTK